MSATILLLDTEERVFKAINRLIRTIDARLISFTNVNRALHFCRENEVNLILADTNIPDTDVTGFLASVTDINALTRKVVLTSYADLEQTMSAINDGRIHRYFTKPWDAQALRAAIVEELDKYAARKAETEINRTLGEANESLAIKADFTARLLEGTTNYLATARYHVAAEMLMPLLEARRPGSGALARRITREVERLAESLALKSDQVAEVRLAADLFQVGMLGLPDYILDLPVHRLPAHMKREYQQYATLGAAVLSDDSELREVEMIVRHHLEDFDGNGYPDGLVGEYIPIGARILRVAVEHETLRRQFGDEMAIQMVSRGAGQAYDPQVVEALLHSVSHETG